MAAKVIGLLLGEEDDWPIAFETLVERLGPVRWRGEKHDLRVERIVNEPFDLRYKPRYSLVIDRLAWWYHVPREWLKKIALMDDVYLLNNPFTFQAMEKHSAYCAMMRLGLKVPETWLIPHKLPPDNPRFQPMAERYNPPFDLDDIAERIGYPLFMKPFDGGAWTAVSRVEDPGQLHASYDESGERLMHLQAAVDDYDVFTRSLTIGAETTVMHYDPTQEHHYRYHVEHGFLSPELEDEVATISRLVNAFFRWEFNSAESIVRGGEAFPIDYANASPDVSLTSLHYYFPWAIGALLRWCAFCLASGRSMRINQTTRDYFAIGDRDDLNYEEKLREYRRLADTYLETEKYGEFRAEAIPHFEEIVRDYFASEAFDRLLVETCRTTLQPDVQEHYIEHFRRLLGEWVRDQHAHV
jgi:hypothetical protein